MPPLDQYLSKPRRYHLWMLFYGVIFIDFQNALCRNNELDKVHCLDDAGEIAR